MEKKNEIQVFTGELGKLRMVTIDGKDYFIAKDIANILGYSNPRDAIIRHCKGVVKNDNFKDGGNEISLIPEGDVYRLIIKSKLPEAEKFEKWAFEDVLPSLRQNGAYVSKYITEEQETKLDKYSTNKRIRNTFKNCNLESIDQEFKECMIYHKNKDGKEKNSIQSIIINSLNDRKQALIDNGKGSFALAVAEVTNDIIKKQKETGNKSRGQMLSYKNKVISKLEDVIANLNPPMSKYIILDVHGISENYLYETVKSNYTNKNITVKTNTYNNWIKNFPSHQLTPKEELNVDWDKSIIVFLKFDCKKSFDVQNLTKGIVDQIITREYGENDNIIDKIIIEKNMDVDNYKDGKIYYHIRNVD